MRLVIMSGCGALLVTLLASALANTSGAVSRSARAEISVLSTSAYGKVLVVGNGALKGLPLYVFSGDGDGKIGCGTTPATGYDLGPDTHVPLTCTGPKSDFLAGVKSDDWPAFTSVGRPIGGPGVRQDLLGTVFRRGIGEQVTYAGHPLYLFDPASQPFAPQGEGYVETVEPLAPWHGYWFLLSSTGTEAPPRVTLKTGVLPEGSRVLSVVLDANVHPLDVTVYTFSRYRPGRSVCTKSCSLTWIPLLTSGAPRLGSHVNPHLVGTVRLANGTSQVTYDGRPLFLYAKEKVFLTPMVHLKSSGTAGNGEGQRASGGGSFVTIALH
jgi:predicted lipoprotein with Yx(FWY)xxD motif